MATKQQAERILAGLGLELAHGAGKSPNMGFDATIDAVGRKSFAGDCRGHVVCDYTAKAAEFWQMVIDEARSIAPTLMDCPHAPGECEFHDSGEED